MSTLQTRSHATIVASIAAGMQGRVSRFLNFAVGTFLLALSEAFSGQVLWLQFIALQIQMQSRLSTSFGSDVDSWLADWPLAGVTRLGAQPATALCVFGRNTAGPSTVYVPVGAQVKTTDGTQTYAVVADTTNPAYVASYQPLGATAPVGGYAMAPQVGTVTAPVQAVVPGSAGNVAAGQIAIRGSSIPGVDTVTNPAAATNGIDQESDASVKARFLLAVQGRGGGTIPAIQSAVANIKVGMQSVVLENQDYNLAFDPGMVTVIVDDGSGNISSALKAAAQAAVNGARAGGIRTGTYAAVVNSIAIVMQIASAPGYYHPTVVAQVVSALGLYVNGLGLGSGVSYFETANAAMAVPGVSNILGFTLNGAQADIPANPLATPKVSPTPIVS